MTTVGAEIAGQAVAAAADALDVAKGEQLPLFEVPSSGRSEALQALTGAAAARAAAVRAGPGRPKGSANRSTAELRSYLLARGTHPLESLMRWAMHTPESLAEELNCSRLEAFDRLKAVWAELSPYFASRLAPTDDQGKPVPFLNFILGGGSQLGGERPPWETGETAEISHSAPSIEGQSHASQSHEEPK